MKTRQKRWWIPILIVAVLGGCGAWLHLTENVARYVGTVALILLAVLLLALWFVFGTGLPARKRWLALGIFALVVAGMVLGVANFTRWEGSLGGGAIPRLVPAWIPEADSGLGGPSLMPEKRGVKLEEGAEDGLRDFPQFLGPRRDGRLSGIALARDWAAHPPVELWRRRIGLGWSAFAVRGRRAVTQEQRETLEMVACYDVLSGELLWTHENAARFSESMGGDGPRATPTIEEGRVYALGATGILDCLDLEDGSVIWSRNILADNNATNIEWGKSSSPLIAGDFVVVTGGETGGPTVLAYDKGDGAPGWQSGEDAASYASVAHAVLCGEPQLISVNANTVTAHVPATGQMLWTYDWPANFPKSSQPVVVEGDRILLTASYGLGSRLLQISGEGGDGVLEAAEVWSSKTTMKTKFSNVCVADGFAYGLDEGRLACIEIATGVRRWKGGKFGYGQNLLVRDVLVVQAERGDVVLVEANPEAFVELGRISALPGMTWNNPVLAGPYLLVRNGTEAVCYRLAVEEGDE